MSYCCAAKCISSFLAVRQAYFEAVGQGLCGGHGEVKIHGPFHRTRLLSHIGVVAMASPYTLIMYRYLQGSAGSGSFRVFVPPSGGGDTALPYSISLRLRNPDLLLLHDTRTQECTHSLCIRSYLPFTAT